MEHLQQDQNELHETVVDLAEEYSKSKLSPDTEGYSLPVRKKFQSFDAYDIESAFEEGQKHPTWTYSGTGEDPEEGVIYLVDDAYVGFSSATYNREKGEWIDENGNRLLCADRWMIMPKN